MSHPASTTLPPAVAIAFKEWAVVCEALAAGRQSIILRKGGIDEGRDGFRVQHSAFWLYPTNFHQQPGHLSHDAAELLTATQQRQPPAGELHLQRLAVVDQVAQLTSEKQVQALRGFHIWSESTVSERFHYRRPGLFFLVVRVYCRSTPHVMPERPEMAGCKSWVELPVALSTDGLTPALADANFVEQKAAVLAALGRTPA